MAETNKEDDFLQDRCHLILNISDTKRRWERKLPSKLFVVWANEKDSLNQLHTCCHRFSSLTRTLFSTLCIFRCLQQLLICQTHTLLLQANTCCHIFSRPNRKQSRPRHHAYVHVHHGHGKRHLPLHCNLLPFATSRFSCIAQCIH